MQKTVKELFEYLIKKYKKQIKIEGIEYCLNNLLDIKKLYEQEIGEKDKEINIFKQQIDMSHNFNQNLGSEIEELKQQQLFKEYFIYLKICEKCREYEDKCKN